MKEIYNGWTNRETWLIPLWWNECPIESLEAETKDDRVDVLEAALEDYWEEYKEMMEWPTTGLASDMMGDHLINWREIAEHWVDDVEWTLAEETEEEEA